MKKKSVGCATPLKKLTSKPMLEEIRQIPPLKEGVKTTEFWLVVMSVIVTVLSMSGVIGTGDVTGVAKAAEDIVVSVFTIISSALYIYGRLNLKRLERQSKYGRQS